MYMKAARYASILSALAVLSSGCSVELEHGLDERQANRVTGVLEAAGVSADKVAEEGASDAYKIVVARSEAGRAFALLDARDLPRREQHGLADTFAASSLLPSATEDRARLGAALAAELERTLEGVPGVVGARVHLALPVEEPLVGAAEHARPTASVLLKAAGALPLADADVQKIVAGAVPGMQAADVSVVRAGGAADAPAPPFEPTTSSPRSLSTTDSGSPCRDPGLRLGRPPSRPRDAQFRTSRELPSANTDSPGALPTTRRSAGCRTG